MIGNDVRAERLIPEERSGRAADFSAPRIEEHRRIRRPNCLVAIGPPREQHLGAKYDRVGKDDEQCSSNPDSVFAPAGVHDRPCEREGDQRERSGLLEPGQHDVGSVELGSDGAAV